MNLNVRFFFRESLHFYWIEQNSQHHHRGGKKPKPQQSSKRNGNLSMGTKNLTF